MKPTDIDTNPALISKPIQLSSGEPALLRPLQRDDAHRLGPYFINLSAETRRLYAPHAFDQETADRICAELDSSQALRLLATRGSGAAEEVIGYFILVFGVHEGDRKRYEQLGIGLDGTTDCTLAPSVADVYQSTGLGSIMLEHLYQIARNCGRKRMVLWGGVRQDNPRAVHFYRRFGFVEKGQFPAGGVDNYDMIAPL
ncbi:MAG: GNAT family N-acetyltransferase [Candidatus Latescibacteria bacterium]|nr:GNAT family N-acetyltransferase [Candidatus Latescibacterota bacterium]